MEYSDDPRVTSIRNWLQAGSINIFGMPYAGKDTQGQRLANLFNAPLLGGGDILRNSVIPPHVKAIVEAGQLAPIEDYLRIVLPFLSKPEFTDRPLMLSSVGRWKGEEEGVIRATQESGHPTKAVVYLKIGEPLLRRRWQDAQDVNDRGERADDAAHVLDTRIQEFHQKTLPVLDAYRELGLLIEINGDQDPDAITDQILQKLFELAQC